MNFPMDQLSIKRLQGKDRPAFTSLLCLLLKKKSPKSDCKDIRPEDIAYLDDPQFIAYGVFHKRTLVGGFTAFVVKPLSNANPKLDLRSIVVQRSYMNKGLGMLLQNELHGYCRENGIAHNIARVRGKDIDLVD